MLKLNGQGLEVETAQPQKDAAKVRPKTEVQTVQKVQGVTAIKVTKMVYPAEAFDENGQLDPSMIVHDVKVDRGRAIHG